MSERHLKCVWKVLRLNRAGAWKVSRKCLKGVRKVSGRCLNGVWKVSGSLSQERSSQVRTGQVKS